MLYKLMVSLKTMLWEISRNIKSFEATILKRLPRIQMHRGAVIYSTNLFPVS